MYDTNFITEIGKVWVCVPACKHVCGWGSLCVCVCVGVCVCVWCCVVCVCVLLLWCFCCVTVYLLSFHVGYIEEACIIPCPSDCKLSEWSNWSRCSKSCGSGVKVRSKWLREKPYNGGRPCPKLDHIN